MSILDLLLETDVEKMQARRSKDYEVKRLSRVLGKKFVLTCKSLTNEQVNHIGEISSTNMDMKRYSILEACSLEGTKLSNKDLMDKFKVVTPIDLLNKLFLPGEISSIYNVVTELSGYGKDAVAEIKN